MSRILTREEFVALVDEYGRTVLLQDVEGEGRRVAEAYDAALARIAELDPLNKRIVLKLRDIVNRNPLPEGSLGQNLEDVIDRQITALMRENELLGQHNAKLQRRIAGLDRQLESVRKMLGNACEILGGEQAAVDGRLAYRARIAREFVEELQREEIANDWEATKAVLARWEAAAKEGE